MRYRYYHFAAVQFFIISLCRIDGGWRHKTEILLPRSLQVLRTTGLCRTISWWNEKQPIFAETCWGLLWGLMRVIAAAAPRPNLLTFWLVKKQDLSSTSPPLWVQEIFVVKILWLRICGLRGSAHVIQCLEMIQTPWTFSHFVTVKGILLGLYVKPTRSRTKLGSGSKMFETANGPAAPPESPWSSCRSV